MADEEAVSSQAPPDQASDTTGASSLAAAIASAFDEVGIEEDGEPSPATEKPEEKKPAEGEEPKPQEREPGKPEEGQPSPAPKVAAPAQWDAAKRAQFDKLPDAAKEIVLDLAKLQERDYTRKTQELANERRFAQSVMSLITDEHREQLRDAGLNEVQGIQRLLQYQDYALRQPADYVRWFAQAANLQPQAIFPELAGVRPTPQARPGQPQGQPQRTNGVVDPQIAQLRGAVEHLTGWVSQYQEQQQQEQQQQRQQNERHAMGAIERFRSAVDEKGVLLRPHFARLEEKMTRILLNDPEINELEDPMERLQEAYEAAISRDKDLRAEQAKALAAQQRTAEQRQKDVVKAKAAVPPISSPAQISEREQSGLPLKDQVSKSIEAVLGHS